MHFHGRRTIRLWTDDGVDVAEAIDRIGHVPLPPYIKRPDRAVGSRSVSDRLRARTRVDCGADGRPAFHGGDARGAGGPGRRAHRGDAARRLRHVQADSRRPRRGSRRRSRAVRRVRRSGRMRSRARAAKGAASSRSGRRRCGCWNRWPCQTTGACEAATGETTLFIRPGHEFRIVNGLITNFHLPQSSLLVLVAAFAGRERILEAYRAAVARAATASTATATRC